MDDKKPKKKWVSSRLKDKKKELGISDKVPSPVPNNEVKEFKKTSRKVNKSNRSDNKSFSRSDNKSFSRSDNKSFSRSDRDDRFNYKSSKRISKNRKKHVVRISNLPEDVTSKELVDLISEWGEIGNVNIKSYSESVSSYIDFYNKNEADYFVEALDTTPFDHYIIKVEIMNFDNKL